MRRLCLALLLVACAPVRGGVQPIAVAEVQPPPSVRATRAFLIASAAEARGDLETAERAWVFLAREDRDRAVAHAYLARFFERQRRWAEAVDAWVEALEQDPRMWEAHAALASLAGRADDPASERAHLERAVELGGSTAVHERLLDVQRKSGHDDDARRTLDRWYHIDLTDPIELLHRARAARSLDHHERAVSDLVVVAAGARGADAAPLLWESAQASCRQATAWRWGREADLDDAVQRSVVLEIAAAVGDASLLERALLGTVDAPMPADHPRWLAPPLVPPSAGPLPGASAASDAVRVAEAWRRSGNPGRALEIATPAGAVDPWLQVSRARALVALDRPDEALLALGGVAADHPASAAARALELELGAASLEAVRSRVHEPAFATVFADAMADAVVRGPRAPALRLAAQAGNDPRVVVLPAESLTAWLRARDDHRVREAVAAGDVRTAREVARGWRDRDPSDPAAWVALSLAEPERADRHLDAALRLDPCNPTALVERVRSAPEAETLGWLDRAREADPLSRVVRRALAQRGLEVP